MDQAPGPIIAKVAPSPSNAMPSHGLSGCEMMISISAAATIEPATGVHKPSNSSIPAQAAKICETLATTGRVWAVSATKQ